MLAVSLLVVSLVATQSAAPPAADLFYGYWSCLAVSHNQSLNEGEQLIILAADVGPTQTAVGTVRRPSAGSDCWNQFRAEQPSGITSLSLAESLRYKVLFAVRPQPDLRILAGPPSKLSVAETERWTEAASSSLSAPWRTKTVLAHAYRYGPDTGQAIVELYLGRATLNPTGSSPPIQAVTIRRFFIIDGQLLASEQYERQSDREERVDTEPPRLTLDNWSASETERTVAFLSADGGRSWTRLSTDVGFEGIWWIAQALRAGLPRTYERYLYTYH